ncbi:MAG: release factor glutamine methyltransferase [Gaiellaceae bacterium]|nr:release factor glutamine methyltransferase [Gaiellaceae bacterium]MDX6492697.1 release factor glutamine methyltransferase [Gaiellaceae bacterium]MDX6518566.1 release factor glutamine methyltransferase [Gaiellaceae bacterium]
MTLAEALRAAAERLAARGVPDPQVDAEWLFAKALGCSRAELALARGRELTPEEDEEAAALVVRRAAREPLAYVLGEWGFRRLTLRTDPRALVPRPETEVLVERCLELLAGQAAPLVLDVGVGSGAIALALADEHPGARVHGVDVSADALTLADENARRTGLADRVVFELGEAATLPPGPFDLVVSNPPYVEPGEVESLEPEVRDWEPRAALVGPDTTEAVVSGAWHRLRPGGFLVLETHASAARDVAELLRAQGYEGRRITLDLAGRERVVEGTRT